MLVAVFLQAMPDCKSDCVVQAAHTATRVRVDGVLDEPVWERAGSAGDFLQYAPDEGAPATLNTRVYLLHDARTLFIGAKLADPEPKRIRRTLGRRDEFTPGDWFVVSLDTYNDRKTSFNFAINAAGVRVEGMGVDEMLPDGSGRPVFFASEVFGFDPSWDVEWSGTARVDSSGWTVELAIPLSSLEIAHPGQGEVGINFRRWAARRGELTEWSLVRSRDRSHGPVARFGRLRFEAEISPGVHRSITPLLNAFRVEDASDGLPAFPVPGVEGALALRPSLVLDGALLPDFTPENFDEYSGWVLRLREGERFIYPRLFPAARRLIGSPHIAGGMLETTEGAPLMLGALALHGRTPFGLTVGATGIAALAEDFLGIDQGFSVRLLQDAGRLSKMGFTGTLGPVTTDTVYTRKDTTWTERRIDTMTGVASVDWDLRFGDNTRRMAGQVLLSREQDILVKTDSGRVRNGVDEDRGRTRRSNDVLSSLRGVAARLDFEQLGRRWNWYGRVVAIDPEFRTGPIGMTGQTDRILFSAGVHHTLAGWRLAHQGRISMQWTNEFAYADIGLQATRFEGYATLLTHRYNEVSLSAVGGSGPSGARRFGGDFEISSDMRRNWVIRPHIWLDLVEGGVQNWGTSAQVIGRMRSRIIASAQVGVDRYQSVRDRSTDLLLSTRSLGADILRIWPAWDYTIAYRRHASSYVPYSLLYGPGRVGEGIQEEFREAYGRVRLAAGILRSLDVEFGMGVHVIGYSPGTGEGVAVRRTLRGSQANLFAGVRWEYKPGSILSLGVMQDRDLEGYSFRDNTWDLFTIPFGKGGDERFYVLRISRKIWR